MRSQLFDEFWTALKPTSGPVLPEGISEIWAVHDVGLPTGLIWIWDGTTWAFDTWTEEDLQPAA
jgi:hypothetical protein